MGKDAIIFGCGNIGRIALGKLRKVYNVIAFTDNDENLWNQSVQEVGVISPRDAFLSVKKGTLLFVALYDSDPVREQIREAGIEDFYVWKENFFYLDSNMSEISATNSLNFIMHTEDCPYVLFVQNAACIRTHKIARALKQNGCKVYLAYSVLPPEETNPEYIEVYDGIIPIMSFNWLIQFVNGSEFDYIHCSNEPDHYAALLSHSKRTVIHDCHDMGSAYRQMTPEEMEEEFIATCYSSGVVYTTEQIRQYAMTVFGLPHEKTFVLENLISEELEPTIFHEKLSVRDGQIHAVYEGGIIEGDRSSHRFFEDIFKSIADAGIYVHFYTNCLESYCVFLEGLHPNIHYEGNFSSSGLANEMTKYDVGLCILNVTDRNKKYLEAASPNKISEYINAGLPVAVGSIESQRRFVEDNGFGRQIDFDGDIFKQFDEIKKIKIREKALRDKNLTMESQIPGLLKFYENCKSTTAEG